MAENDKEATKDDRRTGRQTEGGEGGKTGEDYGAETGALAQCTCCHIKGDTIRVGFQDGEGRRDIFFFLPWGGILSLSLVWLDMGLAKSSIPARE